MSSNRYVPGQFNVICDVCGFQFKSGQVKKRWDGLIVDDACFEQDHPQKYIRVKADRQTVPFVRKEPTDVFILVCTLITKQAIAGVGVAGCMVAGYTYDLPNYNLKIEFTEAEDRLDDMFGHFLLDNDGNWLVASDDSGTGGTDHTLDFSNVNESMYIALTWI